MNIQYTQLFLAMTSLLWQ